MSTIGSVRIQHEEPSNLDFIDWDILIPAGIMIVAGVGVFIQLKKWWTHEPRKDNAKARAVYRAGNKDE